MKINSIIGLLLIIILLGSCRKDNDATIIIEEQIEQPRIYHDATVTGRVIDENGLPLDQAVVTIIDNATSSDNLGEFTMVNVKVNAAGSLLKSTVKGYLPAYAPFFVERNELIDVKVVHRLPKLTKVETADSKELTITSKITSKIGNALFEYKDGSIFIGNANISIELIEDESIIQNYPIGLSARDKKLMVGKLDANKIVSINAFDQNGDLLKLKYGKSFTVKIEDSGIGSLNSFTLSDLKESWIESDNAVTNGNLTTLTIDRMDPIVFGTLKTTSTTQAVMLYQNGDVADHQQFTITSDKSKIVGVTNSLGELSIVSSLNTTHVISVLDICGNVLMDYIFESKALDRNLGEITISGNRTSIKFDLMNCDLSAYEPADAGIAEITFGDNRYVQQSEGNVFELKLLYCREASNLTIKDGSDVIKTIDIRDFITNSNVIDIHKLYLCEDDVAGVIKIGEKMKVFKKDEFYILIESAGMYNPLTFTDASDFTLSLNTAGSVGNFQVDDFNSASPDLVACNDSCGSLQMTITVFGPNIGDRSVGHLFGELDGKIFIGFFDDTRFN